LGQRLIAPPGQEGWREAPGWWFKKSFSGATTPYLDSSVKRANLSVPPFSEGSRFPIPQERRGGDWWVRLHPYLRPCWAI